MKNEKCKSEFVKFPKVDFDYAQSPSQTINTKVSDCFFEFCLLIPIAIGIELI